MRGLVLFACIVLFACTPAHRPASIPLSPATARAWPVMGTLLEITVWEPGSARAAAALEAARAAVFRVDSRMSLYQPESDLSVVNRRAGSDTATFVSPETAEVLAAALRYAALSGGAFDPTVGPLVNGWGFYRDAGGIPPPAVLDSVRALVGYRRIEFDPATRAVRLPVRGMRLDFGAIAKGYAVDRAVEVLRGMGVRRGMVDLGGNLRVFGPPPRGTAWEIGLRDPRAPEEVFAVVTIDSGAVATSGDYEQFFMHEGVRYSHLFDPRTGWPARGTAGVSVIAPTGEASDALSTTLFVLGPEAGCALAERLDGVEAVWMRGDANGSIVYTEGLVDRLELLPPADSVSRPVSSCPAS